MNAVTKALSEIRYNIPNEILNIAFKEHNPRINNVISLDERILSAIIRPRILVDCNLVGGVTINVDLNKCNISNMIDREYILEIPKQLTGNRSIVSVLSLVSNVMHSGNLAHATNSMSAVTSAAVNMMNNLGVENVVQTSRLELIGDNTVLVQDPSIHLFNGVLRCVIENNANLENINPRSYLSFSKLAILGAKSYIHNTCRVKIDQGYIYGGHELGTIRDIVDSYSDAEEMYQEQLNTVWRKVAFNNDGDSMSRLIKSMMGNTM